MKFEFVVTHRLDADQLKAIIEAIRPPAPPEVVAPPPPAKSSREVLLDEWLDDRAWGDANEESHAHAMVQLFLGKRPPQGEWTRSAAIKWLLNRDAPLGV